jgi:hypothetical protein
VEEEMKKGKIILIILLSLCSMAQAVTPGCPELQIGLRRDFGYASGTGKIQGTFTISASGSADLTRVVFYLDGQTMGEVQQAPFSLRFSTDTYNLGEHIFSAVGYTSSGRKLQSSSVTASFVTAKEGWEAGLKILVPILSLVFGVTLLTIAGTVFSSGLIGKKLSDLPPGAERHYGIVGGAICPRCKRPFSRHVLSPNMVVGKLERCPYCGKISVVAARPLAELRAAEAAELAAAGGMAGNGASPDDQLRKELDDSRFQDL